MTATERETGRDIDKLIADLTLDEKAALTAGLDMWATVGVDRLGVPSWRVTDGPNGARGAALMGSGTATSACVPCGSALAATWNLDLVQRIGAMLGEEARTKECRVLLAPTVNIHRSPLAGRNFECYSEDPHLAGRTAAAFVRGVQSQGVATTVKHLAGNEAETDRFTVNSVIDERALREIYLVPFELAVVEGGALGIMTAYNRLNGTYCGEHHRLLDTIVRGEWGFRGFVVSDWFAVGTTEGSARAGLDLEMPGPGRIFGPALADAVRAGTVDESLVDAQVGRLLGVFDRLGAFDDPPFAEERSIDRPEHRVLARRAATEAMVLLKNDGVLPLAATVTSLAVIGPNADRCQIMGGGSASLRPHYRLGPLRAIRDHFGDDVTISHEPGCDISRSTPPLGGRQLASPGLAAEFFAGPDFDGAVVHEAAYADGQVMFFGDPAPGVTLGEFSMRAKGSFTASETGPHLFTLVQAGRARLLLDGRVILDGMTDPPPRGTEFFGAGSTEISATVELRDGETSDVVVEYTSRSAAVVGGVKIGCRPPVAADLIERAVASAAGADVAIVIVGTTDEWESEGSDRTSLDLPGRQAELVSRVSAANPNTVVVVNTGSPVTMDWAQDAAAVLQAWFGGQEMAAGLVDVLTGIAEPGGRLPTTFPVRIEHTPSYGNFPGEGGETRYGEGVLVGYRWYEARHLPTRFAFGHGLSYTTFTLSEPRLSAPDFAPGQILRVEVDVTNTGSRPGLEVVQCYVGAEEPRLIRPPKELKAFAKVALDAGETTTVTMELGDRAFSYWDPADPDWEAVQARLGRSNPLSTRRSPESAPTPGWRVDPGTFWIHVGRSSADVAHRAPVTVTCGAVVTG